MAATSSGHRRFAIPDDDDEDKNNVELKGTFSPTPHSTSYMLKIFSLLLMFK